MKDDEQQRPERPIPFAIDRSLRVDISTQVTDGLRLAIQSGFYGPGAMVPTVREFAHDLGVSIRAPQAAFRTLTREGLLVPRRHIGTFVARGVADVFHGRVVTVNPDMSPIYFNTFIETRLCDRFLEAGYIPARIAARIPEKAPSGAADRHRDVSQFRMALQQKTSLAVFMGAHPHSLERVAEEMGVPFGEIGIRRPKSPFCVAFAYTPLDSAMPAVAARLRARRARYIVQVARNKFDLFDATPLRTAGVRVEDLVIPGKWDGGIRTQQLIVRDALEVFSQRFRRKEDLPDAFLFADDYLARGSLLSLLSAGIRTGRDVLFITLANDGIIPVHPDPVDYILRDPKADATAIADSFLRYLETGERQETLALQTRYIAAE